MKSLQKLSFIGLTIAIFLSSCSMEKRVYMPGYHTEWARNKHNSDKHELMSKVTEQVQTQTTTDEGQQVAANTADNTVDAIVTDENITASLDNAPILPSHNTISFNKKDNVVSATTTPISATKSIALNKKELKNKLREYKKSHSDSDGYRILRIIGWILVILGIITILALNIIGGVLTVLLGVAFIIIFR